MFDNHEAETPGGKPVDVPIPVAPPVVWLMAVNGVFEQNIGLMTPAVTVLIEITVIVPVAVTKPQVPVKGIE